MNYLTVSIKSLYHGYITSFAVVASFIRCQTKSHSNNDTISTSIRVSPTGCLDAQSRENNILIVI